MKLYKLMAFCLMLSLAACGRLSETPAVQPTLSSASDTRTPVVAAKTPIPTATASVTTTEVVTPTPDYVSLQSGLAPGQYIGYVSSSYPNYDLRLMTTDGRDVGSIARLNNAALFRLSPDMRYLAYSGVDASDVHILNLETNEAISVLNAEDCFGLNWGPDSLHLVMACGDIYIYSIMDGTSIRATDLEIEQLHNQPYRYPAWSPDGRWIAYNTFPDYFKGDTQVDGLYQMDTTCLTDIPTCPDKTHFLHRRFVNYYSPSWSPDSRHLAFLTKDNGTSKIVIWDIEEDSFKELEVPQWKYTLMDEEQSLAWSPDGQWFAYSQLTSLYLIPAEGGESKQILDSPEYIYVSFWFTIPPSTTPPAILTSTLSPTFATTPIINSYYNLLLPGQYMIFDSSIFEEASYSVISLDGKFQNKLVAGEASMPGTFTQDGKRFAFLDERTNQSIPDLYLYDLVANKVTWIPTDGICQHVIWSPDETELAVSCHAPFGKINVISLTGQEFASLSIPFTDNVSVEGKPAWSPDGKWLALQLWFVKDDSRTGVYIVEAACLSRPENCEINMKGPFLSGDFSFSPYLTWSPDSRFLAVEDHDENAIYIIEGASGEVQTLVEPKSLGVLFGLAWSPDGEWLAYGSPSRTNDPFFWGVYLLSTRGGEPLLLTKEGGEVYTWIIIPHPFSPGDRYTITGAGADLNLRAEPSLDGTVLRKLQPGDTVTILDGPVQADGYTWWQMQAEDEVTGWAVNIPEWYQAVEQ